MREDPPRNQQSLHPVTGKTVRLAAGTGPESSAARHKLWADYRWAARLVFAHQLRAGRWQPYLTRNDQDDLEQGFLLHFFGERESADYPRVTNFNPSRGRFRDYFERSAINYGTTQFTKALAVAKRENVASELGEPDRPNPMDLLDLLLKECRDTKAAVLLGRVLDLVPEAMNRLAQDGRFRWLGQVPSLLNAQATVDRDQLKAEMGVDNGNLRIRLCRLCNALTPILEELLADAVADDADRQEIIDAVFEYLALRKFRRKAA